MMSAHDNPDDLASQLDDLIRFGVIETVSGAYASVRCGEIVTPPLPWITPAGDWIAYLAPSPGQQVAILCPSGDITGAVILNGIYSDARPAPASGSKAMIKAPDGTSIAYDPATHVLDIQGGSGTLKLTASGGIELTGPVKITGDVTLTGKLTASDDVIAPDVIASGKSLKGHKHLGVTAGSGQTGVPA
jgi:phage baseplate assembly protein V